MFELLTHGIALALVFALAGIVGGFVFLFTRSRRHCYRTVAGAMLVFTGVYWFGVRPEVEEHARSGHNGYYNLKLSGSNPNLRVQDKTGRFVLEKDQQSLPFAATPAPSPESIAH